MSDLSYALVADVALDHDAAVSRVTALLKEQGFGVLTTIDVKATMKMKLDVDVEPHTILGACNPPLALKAITAEEGAGILLPCNVVVRARPGGGCRVFLTDGNAILGIVNNEAMAPLGAEVSRRLGAVRDALLEG